MPQPSWNHGGEAGQDGGDGAVPDAEPESDALPDGFSTEDGFVEPPDAAWDVVVEPPDAAPDALADVEEEPEPEPDPPISYDPCPDPSLCRNAPTLASACGTSVIDEDFSSGRYNVHQYQLTAPAQVTIDVSAERTAGSWNPALIVQDGWGATVHDGERSLSTSALTIETIASGRGSNVAGVRITAQQARHLSLFLTGWHVVDGAFVPRMPQDAEYRLMDMALCEAPSGLLSPPNFDPGNVEDGSYLLPDSQPPGLYERKPDDCSGATKLLIDVLYTVAVRWNEIRPSLTPIQIRDLNEGSCSTVNHETHDRGIDADIVVECATHVSCSDDQPAIELAKLFVDTGKTCGILNNNTNAQEVVNAYFASKFTYRPWRDKFMRSVDGHTSHFHIRVMNSAGLCN